MIDVEVSRVYLCNLGIIDLRLLCSAPELTDHSFGIITAGAPADRLHPLRFYK